MAVDCSARVAPAGDARGMAVDCGAHFLTRTQWQSTAALALHQQAMRAQWSTTVLALRQLAMRRQQQRTAASQKRLALHLRDHSFCPACLQLVCFHALPKSPPKSPKQADFWSAQFQLITRNPLLLTSAQPSGVSEWWAHRDPRQSNRRSAR